MKKNKKGFVLIEGVLIVLILAIIGGTGYYVYNSKQQAEKTLTSAQNENSTSPLTKKSNTPSNTQKYLTIKEWGVRLKLTNDTSSLYYYIGSDNPDVAYLSLKTISDIAPNCAADKFSLAAISRLTLAEQQDAQANPSDTNQPGTIKIGNYYYGYDHSHALCTDGTDSMQAAIDKVQPNVNLADTFQTIELAP